MRRFTYFLSGFIISFVFGMYLVNAETDTMCIQSIQAATNQDGQCKVFMTSCDVPANWKAVPSCSLIDSEKKGISIQDAYKRRYGRSYINKLRKNDETKTKTPTVNYRLRGGAWTKSDRSNLGTQGTDYSKRRASTNRSTYTRYRQVNNMSEEKKSEKNPYQKIQRKRLARATGVSRTGALKSTSNWETETKQHFRRERNYHKPKIWESITQINSKKLAEKRAETRANFTRKQPTLRRTWVGEREQGSLDGSFDN